MEFALPKQVESGLRKFLTHLFTGADNATFDVGRVLWAVVTVYAMVLQGVDVVINHVAMNIQGFATGMGVMFTTGAVGVAVKAGAEPRPHP